MPGQCHFLSYQGVTIYHALQGDQIARYRYSLIPNHHVEGSEHFDVRRLPARYMAGLIVYTDFIASGPGPKTGHLYYKERYEAEREVHRTVFRRAIDDGYDLSDASRGLYAWLQRSLWRISPLNRLTRS